MPGIPPERIASQGHEQRIGSPHLQSRVNIHDIAGTYQARIIEIPRLEEQRIERAEVTCAAGIATHHIEVRANTRFEAVIFERIPKARAHRPSEYFALRKFTGLNDGF